jgi:hypothetical protein
MLIRVWNLRIAGTFWRQTKNTNSGTSSSSQI